MNENAGSFTNLSQTIPHSLSADSWLMRFWGCPSCHLPEEIICTDETSGCIDLDIASLHEYVMDVGVLTMSKSVGNDS